ncbi:cytochrome c3 family protein [Flavobacterium sp.]|uniref:cytochrome c3 family protein n=1 Tax=Flavobacterium sp. TaxID=239 RepID=UPI00286E9BAD|nr:cytochrome c3 family protein [Flavobacterium sp.]
MKKNIKSSFTVLISVLYLFLLSNCANKDKDYVDPRGTTYAGSESCMECHPKIYNEALNSSHYKASASASIKNVLGNFRTGHNTYIYNKDTKIVMENRNNNLFQVYYKNGKEVKAYPFDIIMGAKKAQTSLFWDKDNVYELPLSYYISVNNWGTSPSYPPNQPHFDRLISIDCFECHSSNLERKHKNTNTEDYFGTGMTPETMKKESLVFGIDCERCHGPAKDHVDYHKRNPGLKLAKYIVTNKSLNTQQKLAGCVICHSAAQNLQSRFKFVPGNSIADFYNEYALNSDANSDVHGNQYGLLAQSKCFVASKTMDCTTCHDSHNNTIESLSKQSEKCLSCHSEVKKNFCTTKVSHGVSLKDNCIDCHMPKKASGVIGFYLSGKSEMSPYLLRTHRIGIYQEENLKVSKKK